MLAVFAAFGAAPEPQGELTPLRPGAKAREAFQRRHGPHNLKMSHREDQPNAVLDTATTMEELRSKGVDELSPEEFEFAKVCCTSLKDATPSANARPYPRRLAWAHACPLFILRRPRCASSRRRPSTTTSTTPAGTSLTRWWASCGSNRPLPCVVCSALSLLAPG